MTHPSPFSPGRIGPITLRNRVIKTATFEGMTKSGVPSPALVEHHETLARGGVGMTTVAYCAVHPDGRTFADQLVIDEPRVRDLAVLTERVHAQGARVSLQLGHAGFFTKNRAASTRMPRGPSWNLNAYGLMAGKPLARPMSAREVSEVIAQFAVAAEHAQRAGFDAVELHAGHGYLLSQFLSPAINRRRDDYGGLEGGVRLATEVVRAVRERVGARMAVLVKVNLDDGFEGGLDIEGACTLGRALECAGADALVMSGGFTSRTALYLLRGGRPLARMAEAEKNRAQRLALRVFGSQLVKAYEFEEMFFLPLARRMRAEVSLPLVLLGGIVSVDNLERAMGEGFEFVAMGRALIADPDFVARAERGELERTRCTACNECIAEMDLGGVRCVL